MSYLQTERGIIGITLGKTFFRAALHGNRKGLSGHSSGKPVGVSNKTSLGYVAREAS